MGNGGTTATRHAAKLRKLKLHAIIQTILYSKWRFCCLSSIGQSFKSQIEHTKFCRLAWQWHYLASDQTAESVETALKGDYLLRCEMWNLFCTLHSGLRIGSWPAAVCLESQWWAKVRHVQMTFTVTHTHPCTYVHTCEHTYIYTYKYTYIHTHTHTHTLIHT
jgi:hypothetical protein